MDLVAVSALVCTRVRQFDRARSFVTVWIDVATCRPGRDRRPSAVSREHLGRNGTTVGGQVVAARALRRRHSLGALLIVAGQCSSSRDDVIRTHVHPVSLHTRASTVPSSAQ